MPRRIFFVIAVAVSSGKPNVVNVSPIIPKSMSIATNAAINLKENLNLK